MWQIGEIASRIGQLYYQFYLRKGDTCYLDEAYVFYEAIRARQYLGDTTSPGTHPDLAVLLRSISPPFWTTRKATTAGPGVAPRLPPRRGMWVNRVYGVKGGYRGIGGMRGKTAAGGYRGYMPSPGGKWGKSNAKGYKEYKGYQGYME